MARRKKVVEVVPEAPAGDTEPVPAAPPPEPKITFDMYCARKKVPERRRAGMKAFTKTVRATFAEWESIFSQY